MILVASLGLILLAKSESIIENIRISHESVTEPVGLSVEHLDHQFLLKNDYINIHIEHEEINGIFKFEKSELLHPNFQISKHTKNITDKHNINKLRHCFYHSIYGAISMCNKEFKLKLNHNNKDKIYEIHSFNHKNNNNKLGFKLKEKELDNEMINNPNDMEYMPGHNRRNLGLEAGCNGNYWKSGNAKIRAHFNTLLMISSLLQGRAYEHSRRREAYKVWNSGDNAVIGAALKRFNEFIANIKTMGFSDSRSPVQLSFMIKHLHLMDPKGTRQMDLKPTGAYYNEQNFASKYGAFDSIGMFYYSRLDIPGGEGSRVIGRAYVGSTCAGVWTSWVGDPIYPSVVEHEIFHNLGAGHDDENGKPSYCGNQKSVMNGAAGRIHIPKEFQCSFDEINCHLQLTKSRRSTCNIFKPFSGKKDIIVSYQGGRKKDHVVGGGQTNPTPTPKPTVRRPGPTRKPIRQTPRPTGRPTTRQPTVKKPTGGSYRYHIYKRGCFKVGNPQALRYGPKRSGYNLISCARACLSLRQMVYGLTRDGTCSCDPSLRQAKRYGTGTCNAAGVNTVYQLVKVFSESGKQMLYIGDNNDDINSNNNNNDKNVFDIQIRYKDILLALPVIVIGWCLFICCFMVYNKTKKNKKNKDGYNSVNMSSTDADSAASMA